MSLSIIPETQPAILAVQKLPNEGGKYPVEKLISTKEVCFLYGVSHSTIWRWVKGGLMPSPLRIGRRTYWVGSMLQAHLADLKARHA
ncbi:MAG: helix-turn-helix domain-containing protein [Albidovulum sp.]|nr:MAG: helix-turn-helix domain-containing protein [Defluviimonas sp.]